MKAQDFMDKDNERAEVVRRLIDHCTVHDLSYTYTEKEFTIKLPHVEELPVSNTAIATKRKPSLNWDFGVKGIDETVDSPDELPPADKPLEDGETPESTGEIKG